MLPSLNSSGLPSHASTERSAGTQAPARRHPRRAAGSFLCAAGCSSLEPRSPGRAPPPPRAGRAARPRGLRPRALRARSRRPPRSFGSAAASIGPARRSQWIPRALYRRGAGRSVSPILGRSFEALDMRLTARTPRLTGSRTNPSVCQRRLFLSRCKVAATEGSDARDLLEITVSESGGVRQVSLSGELDMAGVDRFERLLVADRVPGSATVVLDLRALTFIDSSGLRAVIMADQRVSAAGGRFIVVRGPDPVNQVLEMTGVARQIELVDEPPPG